MSKLIRAIFAVVALGMASGVSAGVVLPQIDAITLVGAPYTGDIFTLTLSSPTVATSSYTAVIGSGPNSYQLINNWSSAINSDSNLNSILTASPYCEVDEFASLVPTCVVNPGGRIRVPSASNFK
jgi:hypothetical protein